MEQQLTGERKAKQIASTFLVETGDDWNQQGRYRRMPEALLLLRACLKIPVSVGAEVTRLKFL